MINKTSFADPITLADVPQGGTMREIVNWVGDLGGDPSHTFYIGSFYGTGTTFEDILMSVVASNYITVTISDNIQRQNFIDTIIQANAPPGTYSCFTVIAEYIDENIVSEFYDEVIDLNVLTIVQPIGATIIDTSELLANFLTISRSFPSLNIILIVFPTIFFIPSSGVITYGG